MKKEKKVKFSKWNKNFNKVLFINSLVEEGIPLPRANRLKGELIEGYEIKLFSRNPKVVKDKLLSAGVEHVIIEEEDY